MCLASPPRAEPMGSTTVCACERTDPSTAFERVTAMWPLREAHSVELVVALLLWTGVPAAPPGAIRVAVTARSIQPGELAVFTMSLTDEAEIVRLHAFNREIPTFRDSAVTW